MKVIAVLLLLLVLLPWTCRGGTKTDLAKRAGRSVAQASSKAGSAVVSASIKAGSAVARASSTAGFVSQRTWEAARAAAKEAYAENLQKAGLAPGKPGNKPATSVAQQQQHELLGLTEVDPDMPAEVQSEARYLIDAWKRKEQERMCGQPGLSDSPLVSEITAQPPSAAPVATTPDAATPAQHPASSSLAGPAVEHLPLEPPAGSSNNSQTYMQSNWRWVLFTHLAAFCVGWTLRGHAPGQQQQQQQAPSQHGAGVEQQEQQQQQKWQQSEQQCQGKTQQQVMSEPANGGVNPNSGVGLSTVNAGASQKQGRHSKQGKREKQLQHPAAAPTASFDSGRLSCEELQGQTAASAATAAAQQQEQLVQAPSASIAAAPAGEQEHIASAASRNTHAKSASSLQPAAGAESSSSTPRRQSAASSVSRAASVEQLDLERDISDDGGDSASSSSNGSLPQSADNWQPAGGAVVLGHISRAGMLQQQQGRLLVKTTQQVQVVQQMTVYHVHIPDKAVKELGKAVIALKPLVEPVASAVTDMRNSVVHLTESVQGILNWSRQSSEDLMMANQQALFERAGHLGQLLGLLVLAVMALKAGRLQEVRQVCSAEPPKRSAWTRMAQQVSGTQGIVTGWRYLNCCAQQLGLYAVGAFVLYLLVRLAWQGPTRGSSAAGGGRPSNAWQLELVVVKGMLCSFLGAHAVHCLGGAWVPWLLGWLLWCGCQLQMHVQLVSNVRSGVMVAVVAVVLPVGLSVLPFHSYSILVHGWVLEHAPLLGHLPNVRQLLSW